MHVIVHNAVSVDGRIDGFTPEIGVYYELTARWDVDAHLTGADTLIEGIQTTDDPSEPEPGSIDAEINRQGRSDAPLLVITDSRGRISQWSDLQNQPYWSDVLVLCSSATPETYLAGLEQKEVPYVVAGREKVDLQGALDALADRGVETVLVDSGGTLNGALLRAGLVDEVSVLIHPVAIGGTSARSFIRGPDSDEGPTNLELDAIERPADDLVWLRYTVVE